MRKSIRVSIIIPTMPGREYSALRTVTAISSQVDGRAIEILIVGTLANDVLPAPPPNVRLIVRPAGQTSASAGYNLGISQAQGDLVILSADDMLPAPGWLDRHLSFHNAHPEQDYAALGRIVHPPAVLTTDFMRDLDRYHWKYEYASLIPNRPVGYWHFYTSNLSIKRAMLARLDGPFDEELGLWGYDDIELGYRLTQLGLDTLYLPEAVSEHYHRVTPEEWRGHKQRVEKGAVLLGRKHPELRRQLNTYA